MEFATNFTTINYDTEHAIRKEIDESLNARAIIVCKCSNHPDDDYLYLYIAIAKNNTYIAGLANTSRQGYVGLYENHYNLSFKKALEILSDKIHDCNKEEK